MLDANNYLGKMLAERYRLIRVIGHGASSLVFYAEDMMVRREDGTALPVAIKILDRDAGEYKMNSKSFRTEIHAVAGIPTSPHVVAIKDVSFQEDEHFIVMEYVSGKTLGEYIAQKGGTLPAKEIVSISLQLLQALRLAHEAGVVHRDIKPENIMVERADIVGKQVDIPGGTDMPFVKLADFGIALLPDEDLFAMKDKGVGTVHYISPEQASGGRVDARSDIYSLGVVMHMMATGSVPFDAQSPTGIISKHQTEMPHHVRGRNTGIPVALDDVIFTAMQKNPAARFKDAATMEKRLREVLRAMEGGSVTTEGGDFFRSTAVNVSGDAEKSPVKPTKVPKVKAAKAPKAAKEKKERAPRNAEKKSKLAMILGIGGASAVLVALIVVGVVFLLPMLGEKTYDIKIPNLVGTIYRETNAYEDGITVDPSRVVYKHDDSVEKGKVIAQTPPSGVVLNDVKGVEIILTVSLGPEMADFSIPEAYRVDADTAKEYLRDKYTFLRVVEVREAFAPSLDALPGTVIGARRVATAEDLSLDGDQIFKNKTEEIILYVQPVEMESVRIVLEDPQNTDFVKNYLESNYPYITVTGTRNAPASDPNSWQPAGTVIGLYSSDDSFSAEGRTAVVAGKIQTTLDVTFVKNKDISVVILLAWGNFGGQ